jgi:simple sugar transport system permease protein
MSPENSPNLTTKARRAPLNLIASDPTVTLLIGFIALAVVVFGILSPRSFLSMDTVKSMAFQMPELGILSLAMMVPLMSGGLNLAIIATANLAGLVIAAVVTNLIQPSTPPLAVAGVIALAIVAGSMTALAIGLVTGIIVAFFRVHPILVTLGMMTLVKGIAIVTTRGTVIGGFPPAILFIGNGTILGIPVSMMLFILCAIAVAMIMRHTPFGVAVRMIGSNERATRYSGVDTERVLVGVYTLSSLLCCVAALVMMARFNSARAGYAESYLLITILASVLGGVDPFGGFGKVLGLLLSLLLLQAISTGFNLIGFSPHLTEAIWGATLILAILIALLRDRWLAQSRPAKPRAVTAKS